MRKLDQIIFLNIGQAGLQMSTAFWELMCIEQGIAPDGVSLLSEESSISDGASSLFDISNCGCYVPRAIFIDSEAGVIDEIKTGTYNKLFHSERMINDNEDAANNYARGTFTIGKKLISKIKNKIRKLSENSDYLKEFCILNSLCGGTGTGLSSLILLTLIMEYPKITKCSFSTVSGRKYSSVIVEPYNFLLNNFATNETCDMTILFENQSIYDVCCNKLLLNCPTFTDINRLLSLVISSVTEPQRTMKYSLDDILTNLIPYPRIHYPFIHYSPIRNISEFSFKEISTTELVKDIFSNDNQFFNIDSKHGLYMSLVINLQGRLNIIDIYKSIEREKTINQHKFVEWSSTHFKINISNQLPTKSPILELSSHDKSATMLSNSTAMKSFFMSQRGKFNLLYSKKCFVHWYYGEGMEEEEFNETADDVELLIGDYEEIEMSEKEILANSEYIN